MSRCTGHCCLAFTLPVGPDELQAQALKAIKHRENPGATEYPPSRFDKNDIENIADMAVYLGRGWNSRQDGRFISEFEGRSKGKQGDTAYVYTCKHLRENGDCMNYENRPKMCRDYPYGNPCQIKECTATDRGCPTKGVPA